MSGRYFTFSKIREFIKNPIQQTYERTEYNTMKQESNRTLVRTFVGIYWDIVENVKNTRRLYQELYEPNTNAIRYDSFGHSIQHCYHCQDSRTITAIHLRTNRALSYKPVTNLLFVYTYKTCALPTSRCNTLHKIAIIR